MQRRVTVYRPKRSDYEFRVIGDQPHPLQDFYHSVLRANWPTTLFGVFAAFMALNALFALGYVATGGIAHARAGSFADAFYFSIQTMGTVGYGAMYPETEAANRMVVIEVAVGLLMTALITGLLFAKFSRPTARVVFSHRAVVWLMNGVPTLGFRIGNGRGNSIVDAHFRVTVSRTEHTHEGETFFRFYDLKLVRPDALSLNRSFTLMHVIDAQSPLYGLTPAMLLEQGLELHVLILGLDDTTVQTVHAAHIYYPPDIVYGARLADVLTERNATEVVLDLAKFHDIEATTPNERFPYPEAS